MLDLTRLYMVLEPFQQQMYCAVTGIAVFTLYMVFTDISRISKWTAFRCGYQVGPGIGPIPGPLEDTRITRFSSGPRIVPQYRQTYGPVYRVFCGDIPEVVLTDPDAIRIYYDGDAMRHYKSANVGFGECMGKVLGQSVGVKDGKDWRRVRACVDPHFTLNKAHDLLPVMIADTDVWLEQLPTLPVTKIDEKSNKLSIRAEELVSELPFNFIARRLFADMMDDELTSELHALNELHERVMGYTFFSKLLQYKIFNYLPIRANKDVDKFEKDWAALLIRTCLNAEQRGVSNAVYEMYQNVKAGKLTFLEFAHTVDEILFTNIDVTTASISWATCQIAMDPSIQSRLYDEIKAAVNDESKGWTRKERLDAYIRETNSLLHYCYLESGRLRPVLFYAIPEVTHDAKTIHGFYVPPKTSILIDAYTLNRNSPVWGDDGHFFRPDRFADLAPVQYRYSFWRFGIGPRKCVGVNFGDKIVKTIVCGIFEKYHVELKDNDLSEDRSKFVNAPSGTLIFTPRDGGEV